MKIVEDHLQSISAHQTERVVNAFAKDAEWHHLPAGEVLHGQDAIRKFYTDLFRAFPDFYIERLRAYQSDNIVIVETSTGGTHMDDWMGLPATKKKIEALPLCAIYTFNDDDSIQSERIYYDRLSLLTQLGAISLPSRPRSQRDIRRKFGTLMVQARFVQNGSPVENAFTSSSAERQPTAEISIRGPESMNSPLVSASVGIRSSLNSSPQFHNSE